jgi:hypothetical protein
MTRLTGHGSDAVAYSRNEKARWAGTHRAVFVDLSRRSAGLCLSGPNQRTGVTFERCMDGIGIVSNGQQHLGRA